MKIIFILIVAALGTVSADVSHILAASLAAQAPSSRYVPPIPNALRSAVPLSNFISRGEIGAAQTESRSVLPAPIPTPDSATQGPNPQDIATPEPEYIDIDIDDLPFDEPQEPIPPPRVPAPAPRLPAPVQRFPAPVPQRAPAFSPVPNFGRPSQNYFAPLNEPLPGHSLEADGYHYRTPRRFRFRS